MFAAIVLFSSGLIDGWGAWFSPSPHYRHQTEALLRGELALSHHPQDTRHDLTWSQGAVHQVWGLGIPLWRLPFEALARISGFHAFPDRIAFGIALAIWAAIVLATLPIGNTSNTAQGSSPTRWGINAALILLCPVFLQLCSSRFDIYEEAVAYQYIFGTGLLAGLLRQIQFPSLRSSILLALLAGLGPLIRPTLLFHGIGALVALICVSSPARSIRNLTLLSASFAIGPIIVLATNQARFGHPMEFGHQLNLQHLFGSMYATRFDHPFATEAVASAARELAALLFGKPTFNGHDFYRNNFFDGQSSTLRWREIYLTAYDPLWLIGILAGWSVAAYSIFRSRFHPHAQEQSTRHRCSVAAAILSVCATTLLFGFYLRNGVISSRYLIDFAPAFVAALTALTLGINPPTAPNPLLQWIKTITPLSVVAWLTIEGLLSQGHYLRIPPVSRSQWLARNPASTSNFIPPVNRYSLHSPIHSQEPPAGTDRLLRPWDGIPHNGVGWDKSNGNTASIVILYISNPESIEVDFSPPTASDPQGQWVRARLGRFPLPTISRESSPDGRIRLRFEVQENLRHQPQPMVLFLAFGAPNALQQAPSGYQLHAVTWK